jgi:hypothetical protein
MLLAVDNRRGSSNRAGSYERDAFLRDDLVDITLFLLRDSNDPSGVSNRSHSDNFVIALSHARLKTVFERIWHLSWGSEDVRNAVFSCIMPRCAKSVTKILARSEGEMARVVGNGID